MKDRIRIRRLTLRKTQKQLATALGMKSANTIANWESGLRTPPTKILSQLADELQVSLDYLLNGKDA